MVLAAIGLTVGLAGLTRLLATMLYGVRPADAVTLGTVSLTLLGVGFVASYLPARVPRRSTPRRRRVTGKMRINRRRCHAS